MKFVATRRLFAVGLLGGIASACAGTIPTGGDDGILLPTEYRLGAGDQLRITVFGEADLTGQYLISPQGRIAFPLVGDVEASGKTLNELTVAIGEALQQGYIRQPSVAVEVLNYRPFFILGEVRTPGTYPFSANLTVLNAVATAQGFTYRADQGHVFIKHANEDAERRYRLTTTTPVQPGDTIRIGERFF
ncbi:MAG: polysaccharide export protein [Caulobacterales bacterium]|jgi:polysaccharide export outer membrane protein|nr:polysaccharide export protein [Caulobacterales bacterium]